MLTNCKISRYKIKKILKCFTEDITAIEASQLIKLNRKTINRYYNVFREIIIQLTVSTLKIKPDAGEFIGYIKGSYGYKCYFKIYKIDEKTFIHTRASEKPINAQKAANDPDFNNYLCYFYKRFPKFQGFTEKGYHYQLFESILKYSYSEEKLFNLIWKRLLNS